MKVQLSALLDGEAEGRESRALLAALKSDETLRDVWAEYRLIGDALRCEPQLGTDITSRVMRELHEEPVVLAPVAAKRNTWGGSVLALAASVAGVAVVGWLAMAVQPPAGDQPLRVSAKSPRPGLATLPASAPTTVVAAMPAMQEYLLAHQTHAPGLHMQGGAQQIRTVSATRDQ